MGLGIALSLGGAAWRSLAHAPVDLAAPAQQMRSRVEQALAARARALEPKAAEAAGVRELAAALDMGADHDTFQDLLTNEDWWAPYRRAFPLSAVVAGTTPLAVIGSGAGAIGGSALVREAREHGASSGVLPGQQRAFLAAAARAHGSRAGAEAPVVVVGRLLGARALEELAGATGDALGLSDRAKLIEAAGGGQPARALGGVVGREDRGPVLLEDGRVGVAWPLAADLWMVGATVVPPPPAPPGKTYGLWCLVVGAALLLGGGALVAMATSSRGRGQTSDAGSSGSARIGAGALTGDVAAAAAPTAAGHHAAALAPPPAASHLVPRSSAPVDQQAYSDPRGPTVAAAAASDVIPVVGGGGTQMGRYRLIERIGEGGMAEIFFAAADGAEDFVRHFVVKRLHPHLARNREVVNQFIDEARMQAALVHSNIVPVFDFGKAGEEYFLALEYIHGRDVSQIMQRQLDLHDRPLDLPQAFFIVHEVLEALSFAHGRTTREGAPLDLVHRDVAPGNVLVSYIGEVKLTDFGIVKSEKRVSRTEVGMVKGNASFMSPEQARGEVVDRRSDVFCAGLVLYYCLTGQTLYRGETTLNRLLRAAVGPATSQFSQIERLPPQAGRVLRRALALDPAQRYPNAADFLRDVAPHIGSRADLARLMDVLFPPAERREMS